MTSPHETPGILHEIEGLVVTDRQLAGNSLSLWLAPSQRDPHTHTLWLEPSWHIRGPNGVIAGSRQAQDEETATGWEAVTKAIDLLVGQHLERALLDPETGDLSLRFSGGFMARTFVTDPRDEVLWRVRVTATGKSYPGAPRIANADGAA
jgi:hypothetical protein